MRANGRPPASKTRQCHLHLTRCQLVVGLSIIQWTLDVLQRDVPFATRLVKAVC